MGNSYFALLQGSNNAGPGGVPGALTWWKADSLTGYTDGQSIPSWSDSSGNGHALVNSNASSQPIYVASASNGMPGVGFRGTNLLQSASSNPYLFELTSPMTFIWVSNLLSAGGGLPRDGVIIDNEASNGIVLRYLPESDQYIRAYPGLDTDISAYATPNTYNYFTVRQAGTTTAAGTTNIRVQGNNLGTGSPVTFTSPDTPLIMGQSTQGEQLYGNILEFISYDRYLTNAETAKVEAYLATKYGL